MPTKKAAAPRSSKFDAGTMKTVASHLKAGTLTLHPTPAVPIHTSLTLNDRDRLDALRGRIEQHAMLLQHTLSTEADPDGVWTDRERSLFEGALIELAASILTDAGALGEVLTAAEQRAGGAR